MVGRSLECKNRRAERTEWSTTTNVIYESNIEGRTYLIASLGANEKIGL